MTAIVTMLETLTHEKVCLTTFYMPEIDLSAGETKHREVAPFLALKQNLSCYQKLTFVTQLMESMGWNVEYPIII